MGSPIAFAISTPNVDLGPHIAHALSLQLPEADDATKTLHLFANGPSAKNAPIVTPHAHTMAVNGAIRLFGKTGPDYWIACDPQELVLDFLTDAVPISTTYLVASKCHPKVFERLKRRDVRLWHVSDHEIPGGRRTVPCAVSATLCALSLAMRMGYRRIHVWGWDCCFDGDEHHATPSQMGATPDVINIEVGEGESAQWFKSTSTWCCEVEDAQKILPVLKWAGLEVKIHGPSMLGAILKEYADG